MHFSFTATLLTGLLAYLLGAFLLGTEVVVAAAPANAEPDRKPAETTTSAA